jgi:hypothetical protein
MKILVETSGGLIVNVHRLGRDFSWNGVWEVLDWDEAEEDAESYWLSLSSEVKDFVRLECDSEYDEFFAAFDDDPEEAEDESDQNGNPAATPISIPDASGYSG